MACLRNTVPACFICSGRVNVDSHTCGIPEKDLKSFGSCENKGEAHCIRCKRGFSARYEVGRAFILCNANRFRNCKILRLPRKCYRRFQICRFHRIDDNSIFKSAFVICEKSCIFEPAFFWIHLIWRMWNQVSP